MDQPGDRAGHAPLDQHADTDVAGLPVLTSRLPPRALAVLRSHLTVELGGAICEAVLRAVDTEIGQLADGPALAEPSNGHPLSLDNAQAALADTTGLAWHAWGTGQYLVALDGNVIGTVEANATSTKFAARRTGNIGALPHPFDNVAGAAAALRLDYEQSAQRT